MAKMKYTVPGPTCPGCQYHQSVGDGLVQTRYCNGFDKKRKSKRFKRSDPKYKPPKWCPRLISPPVCRVYGFVNEESEFLEWCLNRRDYKPGACIIPQPSHYRLRLEVSLGKTAKQFYDATQLEPLSNIFSSYGAQVGPGEIVEIDDGLKPYYFYCADGYDVIPLMMFDRSRVQADAKGDCKNGK